MSFVFRPAVRGYTPLIIGIAGPTKAGKSLSALRLATGIARGKPIALLNTEGPNGQQYADRVAYITADMTAPFRPTRYTEAIQDMKTLDLGCAIIDSVSQMHDGPGGILEWHEEILDRIAGKDYPKRERSTFVAWVEPKAAENQFIYRLQELHCPIIVCMRAKEKIKIVTGKPPIDLGWQPIVGERIAFETLFTLMLPPHSKGVPDLSISDMREPFDAMIRGGQPIDEELGERLAAWAQGGTTGNSPPPSPAAIHRTPPPKKGKGLGAAEQVALGNILEAMKGIVGMEGEADVRQEETRLLQHEIFGTRSWTTIQGLPLADLEAGLARLQAKVTTLPPGAGEGEGLASPEGIRDVRELAAGIGATPILLSWGSEVSLKQYTDVLNYCQAVTLLREAAAGIGKEFRVLSELDGTLAQWHGQGKQAPADTLEMLQRNLAARAKGEGT